MIVSMDICWTEVAEFPVTIIKKQPVDPTVMKNMCKQCLEEEIQQHVTVLCFICLLCKWD